MFFIAIISFSPVAGFEQGMGSTRVRPAYSRSGTDRQAAQLATRRPDLAAAVRSDGSFDILAPV
jgi:hypothetical protein